MTDNKVLNLLIFHGLAGVVLLGAISHQASSCLLQNANPQGNILRRYASVNSSAFINTVIISYLITFVLGSILYPAYRLEVRIAFEEMQLGWAIGLFEIKEHWGALGLAALPLYSGVWRSPEGYRLARTGITLSLAVIVWFNFIAGHLLNNYRGL